MQKRPKVIVVGAGIAGLTAAAILSRHSDVTLYERGDAAGGKLETRQLSSTQIDCGPTVFTLKSVFETIFTDAGERFEDHLTARPASTLARHFWSDGSVLDLFADPEQSAAAIASFSSDNEAKNYLKFCRMSERVFATLSSSFMLAPKPGMFNLIRSQSLLRLWGLRPFKTLWRALNDCFDDPRLIQLFARYATYCGASPFSCPATLMLVAHAERSGVWLLDGGMHQMARALSNVAERNGANIVCDAHIDDIRIRSNGAHDVRVSGNTRAKADAIIFAGDVAAIAAGHLGPSAAQALGQQSRHTRSQSAMTWTMAGRVTGPALDSHNVFFSADYRAEFDAVFGQHRVPDAPTVYVHASPEQKDGSHSLFCLINAPANGDTHTYDDPEIQTCLTKTLQQMEHCGLQLTPDDETIVATTPQTYAARFPATGGALYGPASHGWQAAFKRQGVRTRQTGFYLAGGSVHPGPGVPMAALSGRAAAMEVLADFNLIGPSQLEGMRGGMSMQ
jgi:1-hydroxycarotenoid 3,4-desaturase